MHKHMANHSGVKIKADIMQTYSMTSKNLLQHSLTAQLNLKFLLITQHEVPSINTSEATKRLRDQTENGKCTNVTNCRSHVGLSTPFYTENLCYRLEIFSNEFMNIIEEYKNHVTQCITTYCVVPENTHPKDSKVEGRLKNQLVCNGKYEVNLEFPER